MVCLPFYHVFNKRASCCSCVDTRGARPDFVCLLSCPGYLDDIGNPVDFASRPQPGGPAPVLSMVQVCACALPLFELTAGAVEGGPCINGSTRRLFSSRWLHLTHARPIVASPAAPQR